MEIIHVRDLVGDDAIVFPYETFNEMQSIIAKQAYESGALLKYSTLVSCQDIEEPMVVAAPTGCGKTAVFELAILGAYRRSSKSGESLRCLYIAPNKALCSQRYSEWSRAFGRINLSVVEVTGDSEMTQSLSRVAKASIIITTPEKWDSLTRTWRKHAFLLGSITLLLIDEVHHLSEDRGAVLEAVVVRMRKLREDYTQLKNSAARPSRVLALSASLPNVNDIGQWLGCTENSIHYFDETFRPVPLTVHIVSYGTSKNSYLYEKHLDPKVPDIIRRYSNNKPSLIFCASKKGSENLADYLAANLRLVVQLSPDDNTLIATIQDQRLQRLIKRGVAYHHAGLPVSDKMVVEKLYLHSKIPVLTSTSTLAFG